MITIKSEKKSYGINFPTSKEEITSDILAEITQHVKLPKHYCIVALCFQTKIFDFVAMIKSRATNNFAVTPILAKIYDEDSNTINANVGDKLIIDRSSLERGIHLNLPIAINSTAARNYFDSDPELIKTIISKKQIVTEDGKACNYYDNNIVVLEFKIIPVNDVSAAIPMGSNPTDPFIVRNNNLN